MTRVRAAEPRDAAAIAALQVRAWRWAYAHLLPEEFLAGLSEEQRHERWSMWLEHPPPGFGAVVAQEGDAPIGFASHGPARGAGYGDGTAELFTLYIEPDRVGTGVGRALLEEVMASMVAGGAGEAVLWVFADNPRTRRFYERAGWTADGATQVEVMGGVAPQQVRYRIDLAASPRSR